MCFFRFPRPSSTERRGNRADEWVHLGTPAPHLLHLGEVRCAALQPPPTSSYFKFFCHQKFKDIYKQNNIINPYKSIIQFPQLSTFEYSILTRTPLNIFLSYLKWNLYPRTRANRNYNSDKWISHGAPPATVRAFLSLQEAPHVPLPAPDTPQGQPLFGLFSCLP